MKPKISFNAKVTLGFCAVAIIVWFIDTMIDDFAFKFFCSRPTFSWSSPTDYLRLVSHTLGHANWAHLSGNLMFLLLLGPMLEEKHGSGGLLSMIIVTAIVTAAVNIWFFNGAIMGASGIVFMFILLAPFIGKADGTIPIAVIIVAVIFLGREVSNSLKADNVSQMAHLVGGLCGTILGYFNTKVKFEDPGKPISDFGPPSNSAA